MSTEKKWLVKSSDSIMGPVEFDRVVQSIFNGHIHLLDEIKGPFERWRPIKDHSLFAAAIEKLKASTYDRRENTVTAAESETRTHEITASQTISITERELDAFTPTPTPTETFTVTGGGMAGGRAYPVGEGPGGQAGAAAPQIRTEHKKQRFPLLLLIMVLLMIAGGASYFVYELRQTQLIEQKISLYDQLTDIAMDALRLGEYQKALKNFSRAQSLAPKDPNLLIEMSPLSIQFGGQFTQTHGVIEQVVATSSQRPIKKMGYNIIGLSYSYREMYEDALKAYNKSLSFDRRFLASLYNKVFVLIKLKKFDAAIEIAETVVSENQEDAMAHYFYIRSLAEKALHTKEPEDLKEAFSESDSFAERFANFRQEVLFLRALVSAELGEPKEVVTQRVDDFLKVDLDLTKLHVHDINIDFQSFNWRDFFSRCKSFEAKLDEYKSKMLSGFCELKVNNPLEAKRVFEDLMAQNGTDGVLQALYASALLTINDVSRAKNALGFIDQIEQKKPLIETILRGCLKAGDLNCGEAIFRGSHGKGISLLYSHWGNSEVNLAKNRGKAKSSVILGLSISPNFAPLLKIREKMN